MPSTGQTLLDRMEVLHPELQLQSGENDVAKGLLALNMAQDYLETLLALQTDLLGDAIGTISTAANLETTNFPADVLRIDRLQFLDPTTLRPVYDLRDLRRTGGHVVGQLWPVNLVASSGGQPQAYYTDGTKVFWAPLPDNTYSVRWYGFKTASDITAGGTFAYRDICLTPMATMAVRLIRTGLDDDTSAYAKLAQELFDPVIAILSNFQRDHAPGLNYRYVHDS